MQLKNLTPTASLLLIAFTGLNLAGCGSQPRDTPPPPPPPPPPGVTLRQEPPASGQPSPRRRQIDFLNKIRNADPKYDVILEARLNAQNELAVILNRSVDLNDVRPLMQSLLTQMAKGFPGQDLTIIAYAPSNPPLKIGTARLDARTREMFYTPAR